MNIFIEAMRFIFMTMLELDVSLYLGLFVAIDIVLFLIFSVGGNKKE